MALPGPASSASYLTELTVRVASLTFDSQLISIDWYLYQKFLGLKSLCSPMATVGFGSRRFGKEF